MMDQYPSYHKKAIQSKYEEHDFCQSDNIWSNFKITDSLGCILFCLSEDNQIYQLPQEAFGFLLTVACIDNIHAMHAGIILHMLLSPEVSQILNKKAGGS